MFNGLLLAVKFEVFGCLEAEVWWMKKLDSLSTHAVLIPFQCP